MRTYITTLLLATTLILASCGGGNDVASSGASAVSAAATPDVSPASAPSTTSVATQTTEPKINGQIDERTGVAPMVASMTPWSPTANGGCGKSVSFCPIWQGPALTNAQYTACTWALFYAQDLNSCVAAGGLPPGGCVFPGCQCLPGINCY
jgi:predicted small secreted protein